MAKPDLLPAGRQQARAAHDERGTARVRFTKT
jgi:hypothetical protein